MLLSIGLLFSFYFASAQDKRKILPLKQILQKISIQHKVYFNFLEDEIAPFSIPEPLKSWQLDQKISYIQNETKLVFEVTDKVYFAIHNEEYYEKK